MKATLEKLVTSGITVLICGWCGWWAQCAEGYKIDIDAFNCPDCKRPIDAVSPRT
jgi:hypothetical protein